MNLDTVVDNRALDAPTQGGGERFQILALDGGGIKGIFTAAILAFLEDDLGVRVADHFDLLAGTSTGGIITLGLAVGLSPRDILDFYVRDGMRVFRNPLGLRTAKRLFKAKYDADRLRSVLEPMLGSRRIEDSNKRLVVPSYDLGSDDVYVFKTRHHPRLNRDWRAPMIDVALATAAAPTYFRAHHYDHVRLLDGGLWANSPVLVGVVEAMTLLGIPPGNIRVLSVGTTADFTHHAAHLDNGGVFQWARSSGALGVMLRAQSGAAINMARHLLREAGADEDRHFQRIDRAAPADLLHLDRADSDTLVGWAAHVSRQESPSFRSMFLDHVADPFTPAGGRRP
jgi:uncharacterized protein